ncbi:MAG: ABC transporter ATP-binding protein [Bombilactobacillus mellifer]|nr:ABC transporter ATP-binding protein [Bombilactobacillus mellifer]
MDLILKKITKAYGKQTVLDDISHVFSNGIYGLLGANGAGKSTLLNILCGVIKPTSGNVYFDEKIIDSNLQFYYSNLGFLPQIFNYYPQFTGLEFLVYIGMLKGLSKKAAKDKGISLLSLVGLNNVEHKRINSYSGGMKQRLGIAQSLINDPQILILDEPTVGLDPEERVRFRNVISSLSNNKIIILSTHIVSDVEYIADEILILKDGKFKERGTAENLLSTIKNSVWEFTQKGKTSIQSLSNFTLVNKKNTPEGIIFRVISNKKPNEQAKKVDPTLEDLYLYYFSNERLSR